jgi:hypothetical protein
MIKYKFLFIHVPRTGGCFVNNYLRKKIFTNLTIHDSWQEGKNRDWSDAELLSFVNSNNCYIHNHTWNKKVFEQFIKKKWFSFFFIRNPKDIICSRYFYDLDKNIIKKNITLNDFINGNKGFAENLFPSFWKKVSYIDEFTEDNFAFFLKTIFKKKYISCSKINCSQNKGYEHYLKSGQIDERTNKKIESSLFFQEYLKIKEYIKYKNIKLI